MHLSLVGWAANSGVGSEFLDALRNLPVSSCFVLKNEAKPTRRDLLARVPHVLSQGKDLVREMAKYIDRFKPDTILTWETPGSWEFPALWRLKGIRWVSVAHWDWFDSRRMSDWKTCSIISPMDLCRRGLEKLGLPSTLLPVPVDTERFPFTQREKVETFLSIYGYGGPDNRRGFPELLAAWKDIPARLLIRAQKQPPELGPVRDGSIDLRMEDLPDQAALFKHGDIAIQPSRYEGVGVTMMEAQASGLPVIAVDAEPMRDLAPDLLIPVERTETVSILGKEVVSSVGSWKALRERLVALSGSDTRELSIRARKRALEASWQSLAPRWREFLGCGAP